MLKGKFIGVSESINTFVLEHKFCLNKPSAAVLKATALGLYFVQINGVRVGDGYLTPGWTSYNKMLQVQEYDVTALLKEGENRVEITVNEGWYKGPLFWLKKTEFYGNKTAACADLEIDGRLISTDESWTARTSRIVTAGIYDGETVDFTAQVSPLTPIEVPFDKAVLVKQICEPVKTVERLNVKEVIKTPKGELVYDFGQNISGVAEIETPEDFGGTLTMKFAEILADGNFYTGNLGAAKATDRVTCKGKVVYAPEFTYHGFRYMKLEGGELPPENVTALVRHSDMKRTGFIQTSNERVNRLISNIVWGQRDNFVDIPTDCPQRSERLGWTGDINAFCTTAAYNYDVRRFMKKWLADCRNDQAETGEMPVVVPFVIEEIDKDMTLNTSGMWSDCIVTVPYKLYKIYGDKGFLSDNYSAMKKFLVAREKNMDGGLIAKGFEYGDWLSMDCDAFVSRSEFGATDKYLVANFLHVHALATLVKIAAALEETDDEKLFSDMYKKTLSAVQNEYFTGGGRLASDTVTSHALALYFNIVPDRFRSKIAAALNDRVIKHNYRVVTGFVGTPFLLFALSDNGYAETACKVLLNSGFPGWLYEVDIGATTVWERWNTLLPDGTPNPDGMNSCNHYAYGSVMEFLYRRICGIEPMTAGFERVKIAPLPCKGLVETRAEYESVRGKIVAGYKQREGRIKFFAEIPKGIYGELCVPDIGKVAEGDGILEYSCEWENLDLPPFTRKSSFSEIFSNPKASRAFARTFDDSFHPLEIAYLKAGSENVQFAADYLQSKNRMTDEEFTKKLIKMNELFLQG